MRRAGAALGLALLLAGAPAGRAETVEPPSEAPEGLDYEAEPLDSIEAGVVETDFGAAGRDGGKARSRQRVRFRDGSFTGEAREGTDDPLAGTTLETRGRRGSWTLGRLRPEWSCGLVLGGAAEPWRPPAPESADRATPGARVGTGALWRSGGARAASGSRPRAGIGFEALGGRFGGRDLAGARAMRAGASAGVLAALDAGAAGRGRGAGLEASLGGKGDSGAAELTMDRAGRWRAAGALGRELGDVRLALWARAGLAGFRSLAEPGRAGPAAALAFRIDHARARGRLVLAGGLWRFRPGVTGARAALDVATRLAHHAVLAAGFEQQHGGRRETDTRPERFRQGVWAQWRAGPERLGLTLREERWGERAFTRGAVRTVSAAGIEAKGPAGTALLVAHTVYRVGRGENLYLPEAESDRLVLRALTGVGARTRLEARVPLAGGEARAGLSLAERAGTAPRVEWTLHWIRHATLRRSR